MTQIEVRTVPGYKWRMALLAAAAAVVAYYYLGYLPVIIWIAGIPVVIILLFSLLRRPSNEPVIIINDEGVFDRRLKVGTIEWGDIRRIRGYDLHGAHYISLELHEMNRYESRRPVWFKLLSQVQRGFGMSSIAISTNGLDIDEATLSKIINEGCSSTTRGPEVSSADKEGP